MQGKAREEDSNGQVSRALEKALETRRLDGKRRKEAGKSANPMCLWTDSQQTPHMNVTIEYAV